MLGQPQLFQQPRHVKRAEVNGSCARLNSFINEVNFSTAIGSHRADQEQIMLLWEVGEKRFWYMYVLYFCACHQLSCTDNDEVAKTVC